MTAHDDPHALTSIRGIGAKTAAALSALGIEDAADLLAHRSDVDGLRATLLDAGVRGLTHDRVEGWMAEAAARRGEEAGADVRSMSPGLDPTPRTAGRHGEFTIFFDGPGDDPATAPGEWRCRVYHAESGEERPFDGLDRWLPWVAEKLGVGVDALIPAATAAAPRVERDRADHGSTERADRDVASRVAVTGVEVAAAPGGGLAFAIEMHVDLDPDVDPLTAHVDLVCLDGTGRVALAESWDEPVGARDHVARRTTAALGPGAYDVRATVTLAVHDEIARRSLLLELVPADAGHDAPRP